MYQAIPRGLASSTVLDAKAPMVMDRNFKPGFRIDCISKIWRMRWIRPTAWGAAAADRGGDGDDAGAAR